MPIAQFSGLASGIDSKSLIDAIIDARELVNEKRRSEIEGLTSESDALEELNTKLLALNDLIDGFRTANSGGLSKKAASSDPTVATAIVGSNANNASYSITVTSVANSATGSYDQGYASAESVISASGSGNAILTVGTGADQIVINAAVASGSTTLNQLVDSINQNPLSAGRVAAAAVNVGTTTSPNYKLVLTTLQQGTEKGSLVLTADAGITELQTATVNAATDAVFAISGITGSITRSTNSINDVISGVTFNLSKAGTSTINVSDDSDTTSDKIAEIVAAYNEIVKFIAENDTVSKDSESRDGSQVYGSLAKTRIDNDFLGIFRAAVSGATSVSGTAVTSMSEFGISTKRDGTLTFDADDFKAAVGNGPVGVGEVLNSFADSLSGVSGSIYQFTKLQGTIDIGVAANTSQIDNITKSIEQLERQTAKQRDSLEKQFANLESITARMQSSQSALTGILAGLSN